MISLVRDRVLSVHKIVLHSGVAKILQCGPVIQGKADSDFMKSRGIYH